MLLDDSSSTSYANSTGRLSGMALRDERPHIVSACAERLFVLGTVVLSTISGSLEM